MLKIRYRGWLMKVDDHCATAETESGEWLEINKTQDFRASLRLIKNAVKRRERTCEVNRK